jgi:hypothetical protein
VSTILLPFLAALITGAMTGAVVLTWAWALHYPTPLQPAAIVAALATVITWLAGYDRARRVSEMERGIIADPPPPAEINPARTIRVELRGDDGGKMDYVDLPASYNQLQALAKGLQSGTPFAVSSWAGSGKPFSRSEFETLRAAMIARGLATWRNERSTAQGANLTHAGEAVFRYIGTTPPPAE